MFFVANGVLSMISDNVFVATVYINEVKAAFDAGELTRTEFGLLAETMNEMSTRIRAAQTQMLEKVAGPLPLPTPCTHSMR